MSFGMRYLKSLIIKGLGYGATWLASKPVVLNRRSPSQARRDQYQRIADMGDHRASVLGYSPLVTVPQHWRR